MTLVRRFVDGTQFKLVAQDGTEKLYEIETCHQGQCTLRDLLFGESLVLSDADLNKALAEKRIEFKQPAQISNEDICSEDLSSLSPSEQAEVLRRYNYITSLKQESVVSWTESLEGKISNIAKQLDDANPPNWRTVARWHSAYQSAGYSIKGLCRKKNLGNRNPRITPEIKQLIQQAIEAYKTEEKITYQAAYEVLDRLIVDKNKNMELMNKPLLTIPTIKTFVRHVKAESPYELMVAREGKRKADIEFAAIGQSLKLTRVLQRVEVDHTKLDLFVVDDKTLMPLGRPWLSTAVDALTRSIVGFYIGFNPPSFLSLIKLLRQTIIPKHFLREKYPDIKNEWVCCGVPETFVFDNGKEFWSKDLEIILAELNIQKQFNPVQKPWLKGKVERMYGTINKKLLCPLPGKTFSNILEKDDYDPEKHARIRFSTFIWVFYKWVVDVYQQEPSVKGSLIPDLAWKDNILDFPPRHVDPKRLDIILGRTAESKLRRGGIQYQNIRYDSTELAAFRGRHGSMPVTYKVDPDDLGHIYVFDPFERRYIKVLAVDYEYAVGLSEWQHKVNKQYAKKYIKNKFGHDASVQAKSEIAQKIEDELEHWQRTKRKRGSSKTASRLARYQGVGQEDTKAPEAPVLLEDMETDTSDASWEIPTDRTGWSTSVAGK